MFGLSQTWGSSVPFSPSGDVIDLDERRSSSGIRGIAAPEPIPRVALRARTDPSSGSVDNN